MQFTFYSEKDRRFDSIKLSLTATGWMFDHPVYRGPVGPNGQPYLQAAIEAAGVKYPSGLGDAFEELWETAQDKGLTEAEMQKRLAGFSEWMQHYNTPRQTGFL